MLYSVNLNYRGESMAKSLLEMILELILKSIFDDEWKGKRGEKLTEKKLKTVSLFGRKGKVLRNVYLPKDDGTTSEIDVLFITQKGIFVIESKNYSGWIFGDEKGRNWTAMLANGEKNQFYNPILQNKSHLKWMEKFVGANIPLFSLIVFSERCELKKITLYSDDIKVIKRDKVYPAVKSIWDGKPDALTDEQVEEVYNKLEKMTHVDAAVKAAHIDNIEKNYKSTTVETPKVVVENKEPVVETVPESAVAKATEEPKVCPKCGSTLILRTARKGEHAGNQFYGCSGFPKCKYIENI